MARKRCWLFKTEPSTYSIDDLAAEPDRTTLWDGIRNYQARNLLRDEVTVGDTVLLYHSVVRPPAVVGTAAVVRAGYPDPTQFDPAEKYHDPGSNPEDPRWYAVDIRLERKFDRPIDLPELRQTSGLEEMVLLRRGMRLSIQPVTAGEFRIIDRNSRRAT